MIETHHLGKRYGQHKVVDDVSLSIPVGGITSLLGPNGAGKSTLLGMLARLLEPDEGHVTLDGKDVRSWQNGEMAKRLAILRQDNQMTMRLSVKDLVSFGRYPYSKGRLNAEDRIQVERALAAMNLSELGERFLDQLSGGQRQRAFIAMILAQDSDYILLDEPLNGLDLRHAAEMMQQLRRLADGHGKTLILVMHDINVAAAWSDRIVALKDGRLLHSGTPAEIMQPDVLREIYDFPIAVRHVDGAPIAVHWKA